MIKKMISVIVVIGIVSSILMPMVYAEENLVTLYSWDGRQEKFLESEVEAQLTVGWYRVWPVKMWDIEEGVFVSGDEVEKSKKDLYVNRYLNTRTYLTDSGELMYTPREADIIYQNHNWYSEEPVCIYHSNN